MEPAGVCPRAFLRASSAAPSLARRVGCGPRPRPRSCMPAPLVYRLGSGSAPRSFPPASAPCAYVCFCARARRTESARAAALYTHLYPRALRRVPSMRPGPGFVPAQRPRACFRALAPALPVLPAFLHPAPAPVLSARASLRRACTRPRRRAPAMQFPPRPAPEYEKRRAARTNCRKY